MASYGYEALDKSGKVIKGSIDADSVDQAKVLIKKQGYVPTSIKEQSLMTKDINIQIGGKVTPRDMSVFCRQFVSMNKAGVSILECLKLLAEQTENAILQKAIGAVRSDVEKGEALATALAKQYEAAISYIEQRRLDQWTHNKTIRKAIESYRITDEQKAYLRTLALKS